MEKRVVIMFGCSMKYGLIHRENGPAKDNSYYKYGLLHRENGPASITDYGTEKYLKYGLMHREDGPAKNYTQEDSQEFYRFGVLHKQDEPALKHEAILNLCSYRYGYHKYGLNHREDGISCCYSDESEFHYKYGLLHNENGPAIKDVAQKISNNYEIYYCQYGIYHRENGPALIKNNDRIYYRFGKFVKIKTTKKTSWKNGL